MYENKHFIQKFKILKFLLNCLTFILKCILLYFVFHNHVHTISYFFLKHFVFILQFGMLEDSTANKIKESKKLRERIQKKQRHNVLC